MVDLRGFDATKVEPNDFAPIPAGTYTAVIDASDKKPTKKGDGWMIELKLKIIDGPFKGRSVYDRLNMGNSNAQAVQIAMATLSSICRAVKVLHPNSTEELHNKPLEISTANRQYEGKIFAEIRNYNPVGTAKSSASYSEPVENGAQPATVEGKLPWD